MKQMLSVENIELGSLLEAINEALNEVGQDVIRRPYKVEARKVSISITLKPSVQEYGGSSVNEPEIDRAVSTSCPGRKGMKTRAFVDGDWRRPEADDIG